MPPSPPPTKKGSGRPTYQTPADANASLFSTGRHPVGDAHEISRRTERGARIAGDMKRALFFTAILVVVAIVLYQFVSATAL